MHPSRRLAAVAALTAVLTLTAACEMREQKPSAGGTADSASGPITLAVVNARVWTGDTTRPWAEALAVRGDRIETVGSSAAVR